MKLILNYFKDFQTNYLSISTLLLLVGWAIGILFFNFYFDFEDSYIDKIDSSILKGCAFFIYHISVYLIALGIIRIGNNSSFLPSDKDFWIKIILIFVVLAISRSFYFHLYVADLFDGITRTYVYTTVSKFRKVSIIFTGALFLYFIFDKKYLTNFYGLDFKAKNIKIYFILLGLITPFIFAASFTEGFQKFYPFVKYAKTEGMANIYDLPQLLFIGIYETIYAFEFFGVELFFRGILIFGLTRFLGKDVVIPMAFTYAVFHFGKPLGEAISSIFGGYILGVFAYNSKNLWGGIVIHIGIALLMELFSYIQLQ